GIGDQRLQPGCDRGLVVADDVALGDAMAGALDPFDQRVAGLVLGQAPGVGNGEDGDVDREEGTALVEGHAEAPEGTRSIVLRSTGDASRDEEHDVEQDQLFERLWTGAAPMEEWT